MILKKLIYLTIVVSMFSENAVLSNDLKLNWNDLKNKAKNILAESWNKSRGISQVGPKPSSYLDYPGLNSEKLRKNIKLWDLYYKCLKELLKNINKNNIFPAKVITTFKSSSLSLECELCISPKDLNRKNVWYYSWLGNPKNLSLINENNYFRISFLDLSLTIINMDEAKSGYYQCKLSKSEAGPYFIELIKDEMPITMINNTKTNITNTNIVLKDLNLKMWYQWSQWSSCSKCGDIGRKTKFGYCFVSLNESAINKINTIHNLTKNHRNQEIESLQSLLYAFYTGLPCQSNLIDVLYKFDNTLQNKATQIMVEYCEVKCNNNNIFEIKDIKGNVKESVNNSAGIYSSLQIMPELPPKVETLIITTFLNQQLIITCPGNLNSDAPYEWRINNQIISPTSGKITFDILNRLVVQNITEDDEKIYTCWQVDYLAGIVEIILIKDLKISIQEYLHLYGVYFVLGIFIWVGFKIFFDRDAANVL